jgi:hypothetical protein
MSNASKGDSADRSNWRHEANGLKRLDPRHSLGESREIRLIDELLAVLVPIRRSSSFVLTSLGIHSKLDLPVDVV